MKILSGSQPEHTLYTEAIRSPLFDESHVLQELRHFLPAQAPLKDFIHHNTLHAFQHLKFYQGVANASEIFGYKGSFSLEEFRSLYNSFRIREDILEKVIANKKGEDQVKEWKHRVVFKKYRNPTVPRIGRLRSNWKRQYRIDLDSMVHPILFRVLCACLDQGISMWHFPVWNKGFLASLKEIEKNSFTSFFRTKRAKQLLMDRSISITDLLNILIGDERLFTQYLFDQQFAHQGWSGMVSVIETQPETLLDRRKISLHDLICFELLLEIDTLDFQLGEHWLPLGKKIKKKPIDLFDDVPFRELYEVLSMLQEAFEWSYYDEVLAGIKETAKLGRPIPREKTFQALFCIDDRENSLQNYLQSLNPSCETFGTPGFFNVEFFYKPEHGKFYTKLCPAPLTPKHLIKEVGSKSHRKKDLHLAKQSHTLFRGWLITQTLGFWSALRLLLNIFRPSITPASTSSFKHIDKFSRLSIENKNKAHKENDLQVGFTISEMAERVEGLLYSIGLVTDFAPLVYVIGHGASSVNNPHYAAYDCGACSGRPGSVNAKVFSFMANHSKVRALLKSRGLEIPETTWFVAGLHDTTRDEILFFNDHSFSPQNEDNHKRNEQIFRQALSLNAKERARRFALMNNRENAVRVHEKVKLRSVSLFEPRPELNHATNALCVIGRRRLTKNLFLDRRAFLNSYDYRVDPNGHYLFKILKAAAPVCGGINLEYFFSRVDNQKLGAGTKLPHNVMGLFGVANGIDGDLRPGLPSQMVEVHDPLRLLMIVEHFPRVVLESIQRAQETYEWFINEWIHLVVVDPETQELFLFKDGRFSLYEPTTKSIPATNNITRLIESERDNLPVYLVE